MSAGPWRAWPAAAERLISVTLPLSLISVIIWAAPGTADELQLDTSRVAAGEFWRIVTCHFTHWSASHLLWDWIAFVLLGRLCDRRSPNRLLACLAGAAVAVPLAVGLCRPEMVYRGLSGLDSALFTLLTILLLRERAGRGHPSGMVAPLCMLLAFTAKVAYEYMSGGAIFVTDADMVPVPLAHVVGGLIGFIAGAIPSAWPKTNWRLADA